MSFVCATHLVPPPKPIPVADEGEIALFSAQPADPTPFVQCGRLRLPSSFTPSHDADVVPASFVQHVVEGANILQSQIVYVSAAGSERTDGLSLSTAFSELEVALTAIAALETPPSATNRYVIYCQDAQTFNLVSKHIIPPFVFFYAPFARVIGEGSLTINQNSGVTVRDCVVLVQFENTDLIAVPHAFKAYFKAQFMSGNINTKGNETNFVVDVQETSSDFELNVSAADTVCYCNITYMMGLFVASGGSSIVCINAKWCSLGNCTVGSDCTVHFTSESLNAADAITVAGNGTLHFSAPYPEGIDGTHQTGPIEGATTNDTAVVYYNNPVMWGSRSMVFDIIDDAQPPVDQGDVTVDLFAYRLGNIVYITLGSFSINQAGAKLVSQSALPAPFWLDDAVTSGIGLCVDAGTAGLYRATVSKTGTITIATSAGPNFTGPVVVTSPCLISGPVYIPLAP